MAATLECRGCGRTYPAGPAEPWRCRCSHPLDFASRPLPAPEDVDVRPEDGLWTFAPFLPVDPHVTLGEGFTPLTAAGDWDAEFKLDYTFPSGSFKDRGATTTLSRAVELGVDCLVEDSSGNAGAAIAQYAARAGIDADIYVPASAKTAKLRAIEAAGATPIRVAGDRQAVTDACIAAVADGEAWYASHAWNPAFFAGTETFAYELACQRDWHVPDAVVVPLGHGTLFLGAYRGFRALHEAGWTDSIPRMLGVQATGVAPLAGERHDVEEAAGTNDVADGIQIATPARRDQLLAAIETTGGDAIAVGADATADAHRRLGERGFYVEATSAVAVAGLEAYRERGVLEAEAEVVVALTGSGLKA
jgi:threonine synthase